MSNWQGFESLIIASSGRGITLSRLPACGARFVGKGRIIRQPVPCDFVGVHCATGRGVYLDAKSCELKTRFPVGNDTHLPPHQRQFLTSMGAAGGIAGLLVESVAMRRVYWIGWETLGKSMASIEWTDPAMIDVGAANQLVDFSRIVAATAKGGAA